MGLLFLWMICVCCVFHAFASVHCCLVLTCWERADLLALVGDVYCIFVTLTCGIVGQAWYLIGLFPGLCGLSYFKLWPHLDMTLTIGGTLKTLCKSQSEVNNFRP